MKTAKQKLSEKYVQSVYVIRVKGNNGYVMIDENTTDDIEQARAFQYAEALEYVKGFENTYQIVKYNPTAEDIEDSEPQLCSDMTEEEIRIENNLEDNFMISRGK